MGGNRVFVSSTHYDLIDIRAEIERQLNKAGFSPIMSDSSSSDFEVDSENNSIRACLSNVRSSDVFIMILSRRYGPSLAKAGFDNVSATHLEYREAKSHDKPIFVYARDHLVAAYDYWKKQDRTDDFQSPWVQGNNIGLLRLLDEHASLQADGPSNWYSTFQSSTDLKAAIARDLRTTQPSVILRKLASEGKVPELRIVCTLSLEGRGGKAGEYHLSFNNHGTVPAHRVVMRIITKDDGVICQEQIAQVVSPGATTKRQVFLGPVASNLQLATELQYELADGTQIGELFHCHFNDKIPVFVHKGKWHIGESQRVLTSPIYPWD